MLRTKWWLAVGVVSALAGAGCGDSGTDGAGGTGEGGGAALTNVTFHEHVEPILQKHCLDCHSDGQIGGFSLVTFDEAAPMAGFMASMTEARLMPPWGAQTTDECSPRLPFKDDMRLTDEEIATLRAWADLGAPQGDPAKAPPPFVLDPPGLSDLDQELTPDVPNVVEGDTDQFICMIYDPAVETTQWVDGIHFMAGNQVVAHHALTFRLDRDDALELSGGDDRFDCFGGSPGMIVHVWAPGGNPYELPAEVGIKMDPTDVLVVQMHYHPTGTSTEEDASTIQLSFADTQPEWQFVVTPPGNAANASDGLLPGEGDRNGEAEFFVPAGAASHTEVMEILVPNEIFLDLPILAVMPHMHYVGVDLKLEIERSSLPAAQPQDECFVHVPAWDFNWQRIYQYDVPIAELPTAKAGDLLRLTCKYDNSLANPALKAALDERGMSAPIDVTLGEETLDEMCIALVGVLVPASIDL